MKKSLFAVLIAAFGVNYAFAEYVAPPGVFSKYPTQKVVYELNSGDPYVQLSTLTNITNHFANVENPDIVLVVHNEAVKAFLENGGNKNTKDTVDKLVAQGLKLELCNVSLKVRDLDYRTLHKVQATNIVASAVSELVARQQQGYFYLHP